MDIPNALSSSRCILLIGAGLDFPGPSESAPGSDGFRIEQSSSIEDGLAVLGDTPPDVVILDIDDPGNAGLPLIGKLRKAIPGVPVIAAGSDPSMALAAFRSGAADFLTTPFDNLEARERIAAAFSRREGDSERLEHSVRELEQEKKELANLLEISSSFDISGDTKDILKRLTDLAADSMNCEAASIMLVNHREKVLEFVVATGVKGPRLETITVPLGEGIAGWVAANGKPQVVNDTLDDERFTGKVDAESGFVTRQILAVPMRIEGETIGVLEVINSRDNRTIGDKDLRVLENISARVATVISTVRKIENQQNFYVQITNIIVRAVERKDLYSEGHAWRVAELCHKIGRSMNLPENDKNDLHFGALLHDIGKLDMSSILFNKRTVTERELDLIRQHPVKGAKLIEPIALWKSIVPCVLFHHEAWDGSGYPFGREGENIPVGARIIALAEAFSIMRSTNSYKRQLLLKEAVLEIMRCSGKQFDPEIVRVFISVLENETPRY